MCRVDSHIILWRLHFLIQIIVLAACLQTTGGFACNWPRADRNLVNKNSLKNVIYFFWTTKRPVQQYQYQPIPAGRSFEKTKKFNNKKRRPLFQTFGWCHRASVQQPGDIHQADLPPQLGGTGVRHGLPSTGTFFSSQNFDKLSSFWGVFEATANASYIFDDEF
jgi:hypothetical protein